MRGTGLIVVLLLVVGLAALSPTYAQTGLTRFSVTNSGAQANGGSWWPTIDAAGRFVAMQSWADNQGLRDGNFKYDVYVRDRIFGLNHVVSTTPTGNVGNGQSLYPSISADGLHVAFCSEATNFVPGDTNGLMDVYVSDWQAGRMERVSVSSTGEEANGISLWPAVSSGGRYVAFESQATNLIPGGNPNVGIYLRDRQLGTTECLSRRRDGTLSGYGAYDPAISPDGRYVAFSSWDELVPEDKYLGKDIYLRDLVQGTMEVVSVADNTGASGNRDSGGPRAALTPEGRYVAFSSLSSNLVPNDTNGCADVFVRDRALGRTTRVSVSSDGVEGDKDSGGESIALGISADGRYVGFASLADNLVPNDTNGTWDAFLHDCETGETVRLSVSEAGVEGDNASAYYAIATNATGTFTVWDSDATNLVAGDTNRAIDTFLYQQASEDEGPSVVINGDAMYTKAGAVTLTIAPGPWTEVRFRNDSGTWGPWEPALTTKAWTLSAGEGVKRVSVAGRYADLSESVENWDEIILDGTPPSGVSVLIDGGAGTTSDRTVALQIQATGAAEMRLHNEGETWSPWQPYTEELSWQLTLGGGTKRVTVQTRDGAGNESVEAYDEIDVVVIGGVEVSINGEAIYTTTREVTLTLVTPNAVQIRIQNEEAGWSPWQPAAATVAWTLSEGDGIKQVFVQGRDAGLHESEVGGDEITLDSTPPAGFRIAIDFGAKATASTEVTLALTGTDVAQVRFHGEGGTWTAWQAASATVPWTLPGGDGTKRVYAQARDEAGNETEEISDSITLDTVPPTGVSVLINDGAESTLSRTVTLTIAATGAAQMRFRNEAGGWSVWQPFSTTASWQLSPVREDKTVWVQCQDDAGNLSAEASDSITLRNFTDVGTDFWAYSQIMACVDAGVVAGYKTGAYGPTDSVTRAQMAVFIARGLCGGDENVPTSAAQTFPDVTPDYWAHRHIEYCYAQGIVHGMSGSYVPLGTVTRAQMAVFIAKAMGLRGEPDPESYTPPATPSFADVASDFWAYKYIEYCHQYAAIKGFSDGYRPASDVTRAQMAVYLTNAFGLTE